MFGLGHTEIIIIVIGLFLLFGYKKLPLIGENLSKALQGFKTGIKSNIEE